MPESPRKKIENAQVQQASPPRSSSPLIDMKLHAQGRIAWIRIASTRNPRRALMPKELSMRHRAPQFAHIFSRRRCGGLLPTRRMRSQRMAVAFLGKGPGSNALRFYNDILAEGIPWTRSLSSFAADMDTNAPARSRLPHVASANRRAPSNAGEIRTAGTGCPVNRCLPRGSAAESIRGIFMLQTD